MLGRILDLNKVIAEIKKHKWEIEENLLKQEKRIAELEKKCAKKFSKDENKKQLDFSLVKIPELEERIRILVKYLPKNSPDKSDVEANEIKSAFDIYKSDYEKIIASLVQPCAQLEMHNKALRDKLSGIRVEVNSINDRKLMITRISELDGIVSLPLLIVMLQDIKRLNETDIFESFMQATGKDLRRETRKTSFDEICKSFMGVDIEATFRAYTKNTETKDVTEQAVKAQMQKLITEFWTTAQKKFRISKLQSENAFNAWRGYLMTEIYLTCVLETYRFTDDVQMNVGMKQKTFALWMNLREVYNPYVAICHAAKQVQVTPKTEALFREVAIWLKGLYERSYNQVPQFLKDGEGKVTESGFLYIGDQEERDLYKWKPPMTKVRMADNHKYHGDVLTAKLPQDQAQLQPASAVNNLPAIAREPAPSGQQSLPDHIEPLSNLLPELSGRSAASILQGRKADDGKSDDRPRLPSTPPSLLLPQQDAIPQPILIVLNQDFYQMTISLHKNEQEKLNRLAVVVGKVMEYGVLADESELRKDLLLCQSFSDEDKILKLKDCIRKYQLSSNQSSSLMFIPNSVNDAFPVYSEGSRYWIFSHAHAEDARAVIAKINSTANPRVQLEAMFSLRKMLKKNGSTNLLPVLNKILLDSYKLLCGGVENVDQVSKSIDLARDKKPAAVKVQPVQLITSQDYCQMIIVLHKDEVEKLHRLEVVVGKIMEHGVVANEAQMRKELSEYQERTPDEKIKKLKDCIRKFELSANQTSSLIFMSGDASDAFKPYIEKPRYTFFSHAHAEDAKKTIEEIERTENARVQLEKLFALRKLLKKDKSQNLLPVMDKILLKAYRVLSGAAKPDAAPRQNLLL